MRLDGYIITYIINERNNFVILLTTKRVRTLNIERLANSIDLIVVQR